MGEAVEGPRESGDLGGDRKGERGPRDHRDGTVSQDRWEQEDVGGDGTGGEWSHVGDRVGSWGQEWKQLGVEKCTERWMMLGTWRVEADER